MKSCINCNNALNNSDKFCPECGQSTNNKLNLNVLFSDLIGNYLSFDARFFKTIIPLIFKPGFIAKAFIDGKRNTYLHPGKIYLFISVIFFFFLSLKTNSFRSEINQGIYEEFTGNIHLTDSLTIDSSAVDSLTLDSTHANLLLSDSTKQPTFKESVNQYDSVSELNLAKPPKELLKSKNYFVRQIGKILEKKGQNVFDLFFNMISIAIFLLVPIYAFFLKLLFYKTHNFTQNLIFSLYQFTFAFIIAIVYLSLYNLDTQDYILTIIVLLFFIHLIFAFRNFYNKSILNSIFKATLQTSIFTIILLPVTFILLIVASIYFY